MVGQDNKDVSPKLNSSVLPSDCQQSRFSIGESETDAGLMLRSVSNSSPSPLSVASISSQSLSSGHIQIDQYLLNYTSKGGKMSRIEDSLLLPTAHPQRRTGEWLFFSKSSWKTSKSYGCMCPIQSPETGLPCLSQALSQSTLDLRLQLRKRACRFAH